MRKQYSAILVVTIIALMTSACGSNKRAVSMKLHSDPLGAYALMQVKYAKDDNPDWIFLGPTPVVTNKQISFKGATTVSLKVIRPGFYEQVKTWSAKDFLKEYKENKTIAWLPNMVKQ